MTNSKKQVQKKYAEVLPAGLPKWSLQPFLDQVLLPFWFKTLFLFGRKRRKEQLCPSLGGFITISGNFDADIKTILYYIHYSGAGNTWK